MKLAVTAAASGRPNASGAPAATVTSIRAPGGHRQPVGTASSAFQVLRVPHELERQAAPPVVTCTKGISAPLVGPRVENAMGAR
jgi:hypothetical protein